MQTEVDQEQAAMCRMKDRLHPASQTVSLLPLGAHGGKPNIYTLKYAVARTFVVLGLTHFGFSDVLCDNFFVSNYWSENAVFSE